VYHVQSSPESCQALVSGRTCPKVQGSIKQTWFATTPGLGEAGLLRRTLALATSIITTEEGRNKGTSLAIARQRPERLQAGMGRGLVCIPVVSPPFVFTRMCELVWRVYSRCGLVGILPLISYSVQRTASLTSTFVSLIQHTPSPSRVQDLEHFAFSAHPSPTFNSASPSRNAFRYHLHRRPRCHLFRRRPCHPTSRCLHRRHEPAQPARICTSTSRSRYRLRHRRTRRTAGHHRRSRKYRLAIVGVSRPTTDRSRRDMCSKFAFVPRLVS
jgi:hypothetical protein